MLRINCSLRLINRQAENISRKGNREETNDSGPVILKSGENSNSVKKLAGIFINTITSKNKRIILDILSLN